MVTNYVNAITEELTAWRSPGQTATDTASASAWVSTALTVVSFQQESIKIYFKAKIVFGELGRESVSLPVKREMCWPLRATALIKVLPRLWRAQVFY